MKCSGVIGITFFFFDWVVSLWQVKQKCELFAENASERVKLFVKAFCADDHSSALPSLAQAKRLAAAGAKFIQSVKRREVSSLTSLNRRLNSVFLNLYYLAYRCLSSSVNREACSGRDFL